MLQGNMLFDKLEAAIANFIVEHKQCHTPTDKHTISCPAYMQRQKYIDELRDLTNILASASRKIAEELENVTRVHAADTRTISELVEGISGAGAWQKINKRGRPRQHPNKIVAPDDLTALTPHRDSSFILVTQTAGIYARVVELPANVLSDGSIYYIRTSGHFAIRCGPLFLHGNLGTVYDTPQELTKVKYCRYGSKCVNIHKCTYYHDPLEFSGSRDIKNFTAVSFLYDSTGTRQGTRKIGCRDRFDSDIMRMYPEDISYYFDQVAHDFFCAVLIAQIQKTNMPGVKK